MAVKRQPAAKKVEREDMAPINTRWKSGGGGWNYGWFRCRLEDDTIEIVSQLTGGIRTIFPHRVEFRSYGPRGGDLWTSAEQAERPMEKQAKQT